MRATHGPSVWSQQPPSRCQASSVATVDVYVGATTVTSCVEWPVEASSPASDEPQREGSVVLTGAVVGGLVVVLAGAGAGGPEEVAGLEAGWT